MKCLIRTTFLLLILVGCKNNDSSQEYDSSANSDTSYSITGESSKKVTKVDTNINSVKKDNRDVLVEKENSSSTPALQGNYIKLGQEADLNCNCFCLDVNYTNNSELCLVEGKMYINVKFKKNQDGSTNVYYVNPSNKNTEGKDIPWTKFDRNMPIATIENIPNHQVKLDWLGFYINGDLAVDYAIYGKKTMEGNYKIK